MNDTVYYVVCTNGEEYDDYYEWVTGVYTTQEIAIEETKQYLQNAMANRAHVHTTFYVYETILNVTAENRVDTYTTFYYSYSSQSWYIHQPV